MYTVKEVIENLKKKNKKKIKKKPQKAEKQDTCNNLENLSNINNISANENNINLDEEIKKTTDEFLSTQSLEKITDIVGSNKINLFKKYILIFKRMKETRCSDNDYIFFTQKIAKIINEDLSDTNVRVCFANNKNSV